MVYFTQDKNNEDAVQLIEEVLRAHISLKEERVEELSKLLSVPVAAQASEPFFDIDLEALEKSIETVDIQIATIQYTLEYVKLILKSKGNGH